MGTSPGPSALPFVLILLIIFEHGSLILIDARSVMVFSCPINRAFAPTRLLSLASQHLPVLSLVYR